MEAGRAGVLETNHIHWTQSLVSMGKAATMGWFLAFADHFYCQSNNS